jgi:hypothetical protein
VHLARYGGGDDYRVAEPLLSVWCRGAVATSTAAWQGACTSLLAVSASSLQLLHGFSESALLPSGAAPAPGELDCASDVHLMISRMPPDAPAGETHASLMLHGWLFREPAFLSTPPCKRSTL